MTPSLFDVNLNIRKVELNMKNARKRLKKRRHLPQSPVNHTEKSAISNIDRQML